MLKFHFISFVFVLKLCSTQLPELGDQCNTIEGEEQGTCKLLTDCPEARTLFQTNRQLPQSCAPDNIDVVVCCISNTAPELKSKSLAKCKEYSSSLKCDMSPLSETPLVDHRLTSIKNSPYIANILYNKNPADGKLYFVDNQGSLISSRYVLTAATTIIKTNLIPAKIVLGLKDKLMWIYNETVEYDIEKTIMHPNYQPTSFYNDIALIRLSKQVQFSQYIRPICLPNSDIDSLPSDIYRINYEYEVVGRPLVKYQRTPASNRICNDTYKFHGLFSGFNDNFMCTQSTEVVDSNYLYRFDGAPITMDHPNVTCSHVLLGVSLLTMKSRTADVAINVFNYVEWIEGIIWEDDV